MEEQQGQGKKPVKRRHVLKAALFTVMGLGAAGAGSIYYSEKIEPSWYETTYQTLQLPRLTPAFQGYRVVQMSDIHSDIEFMSASRLAGLVEQVNALKPDLVVITGDFVTYYFPDAMTTLAELRHLQARDGVFGIFGNHDHPAGIEWLRTCLQAGHVQDLNDATHTIRRGEEMLHLVGLDDLWPANRGKPAPIWSHLPRLQGLTTTLPDKGAAILLVHEPDFADVAVSVGRYDLELSGQLRMVVRCVSP